ncbi:hypothetical protein V9T40_014754 [Parthenolecanium corni]|uniref:Uncharacterized protein n=1 Tax=Parthenolecanium corni TaxID=536013 RepID=A0AAN9T2N6_9HEMI
MATVDEIHSSFADSNTRSSFLRASPSVKYTSPRSVVGWSQQIAAWRKRIDGSEFVGGSKELSRATTGSLPRIFLWIYGNCGGGSGLMTITRFCGLQLVVVYVHLTQRGPTTSSRIHNFGDISSKASSACIN